jgi:hypothetical protein
MKNLLLTAFVCSFSAITAQSEYNYDYYHNSSLSQDIVYMVPGVKNKTVTIETKNVRTGKTYHYQKTFNEFAVLTEEKKIKKGEASLTKAFKYNKEGKLLNSKRYKNGKLTSEIQIERDDKNRKTSYKYFKRNNTLKNQSAWKYKTNEKCMDKSTLYKRDGVSVKKKWNYEYYTACEKKQSTLTNGKGKVLKIWTYDCKKEGEELTKKKDVSQVCTWEETDDKHLIKVQQTFDEKGKIVKMVSKYRSADTSLISYKRYNSDNELTYESVFNPDIEKQLYHKSYKNGRVRYQTIYKYVGENLVNYAWYRRAKMKYNTTYEYDQESQLVAMKSFQKEDKVSKITKVSYQ